MWNELLRLRLETMISRGTLVISGPKLEASFGSGTPRIVVRFTDADLPRRLVLNPELALGEAYTDQALTIENDDLYGLLSLLIDNAPYHRRPVWYRPDLVVQHALRSVQQRNPLHRSHRNVRHHYDISDAFYRLFLDQDLQYSCAYFGTPSESLEAAQRAKKRHIAEKLLLQPGMKVLDIGCGWGGLALTLAQEFGVEVTGVTLSQNQFALAQERARAQGLTRQVQFLLADYRSVAGKFDRIVSVGMFEHVGAPQFRKFFQTVHDRLTEAGIALIHTIGREAPPASTGPWIRKYIFPGGYVPALSETMRAIEQQPLWTTDVEVWRLHYAETLRHWRDRFEASLDRVLAMYDARFCRMWRYYLIASELSFRKGRQVVFQIQLARQQDSVPLQRDYLYQADPSLRPMLAER